MREYSFLSVELPLDARIGNAETEPFRIALAGGAGMGAHHREVATLFASGVHSGFEQGALHSLISSFRHGAGAGEQGHSFMATERSGSDRRGVQESEIVEHSRRLRTHSSETVQKFLNMHLLAPSTRGDFRP